VVGGPPCFGPTSIYDQVKPPLITGKVAACRTFAVRVPMAAGGSAMRGFRKFLMQGNIIDLAVAVVIGVAFNAIVQALVKYMITPLITAITGSKQPFSGLSFTVHGSLFTYGQVINAAFAFLVIAAVIYWLVVAPSVKLTALATRNKIATERACPECTSMIPVAAKRCMYCTSEVAPVPPPTVVDKPARRARHGYLAAD
jgi:large conductance mechanosensitive channel